MILAILVPSMIVTPFKWMSLLYLLDLRTSSDMDFNIKKSVHLSFKCKLLILCPIIYSNACIPHTTSHKDLSFIISKEETPCTKPLLFVLTKCRGYYVIHYFLAIQLLRRLVCMYHWSNHSYFSPNMVSMKEVDIEYCMSPVSCHQVHSE